MMKMYLAAIALTTGAVAAPVEYEIDSAASRLHVHTKKAGFLARMGHTHEIRANELGGRVHVDTARIDSSSLELVVSAGALKVVDGGLSEKDRTTVQSNMEGRQVLEVARFPKIRFKTRAVGGKPAGAGKWSVTLDGALDLHGVQKPLSVHADVVLAGDLLTASGTVEVKQQDFGIKPFRAAMGAVGVADAVRVSFTIVARAKR
jgi:polyisoprenoid-binding protein YceI